jgi:hypothetical protein
MEWIDRVIDWGFAAWRTFEQFTEAHPANIPAFWRWLELFGAFIGLVLCPLLVGAWFWIDKKTKPYFAACAKREREHKAALRRLHEYEYAQKQTWNDLG